MKANDGAGGCRMTIHPWPLGPWLADGQRHMWGLPKWRRRAGLRKDRSAPGTFTEDQPAAVDTGATRVADGGVTFRARGGVGWVPPAENVAPFWVSWLLSGEPSPQLMEEASSGDAPRDLESVKVATVKDKKKKGREHGRPSKVEIRTMRSEVETKWTKRSWTALEQTAESGRSS